LNAARILQRRPDLSIPETNVHNKEVSRGERLTSINLTFAIVLACIEERSYVAANLLFDVCLPTSNGTHRSRKQEPRSYEWLAAYGRLTACSYPLQSQAHNMLASWSAVDHGRTFHRARKKKASLGLKAADTPLIAQGQPELDVWTFCLGVAAAFASLAPSCVELGSACRTFL